MAVLDVLVYPDARLKLPSVPVTRFDTELCNFLTDLEETMRAGPGSVGIAAPQVNRLLRIVEYGVQNLAGVLLEFGRLL